MIPTSLPRPRRFVIWVAEAIYGAFLIGFFPSLWRDGAYGDESGPFDDSLTSLAMISLWALCITINMRLALENNSWTWLDIFGPFSMMCMLLIWSVIFNYVPSTEYQTAF